MRRSIVVILVAALLLTGIPVPQLFARGASATQYTSNVLKLTPTGTAGLSVTPSNVSWVNSSWVQVTASTSAAWILEGVELDTAGSTRDEFEIDIGTGGAGSEVVVATIGGYSGASGGFRSSLMNWPAPIDNIAASTRVAMRMRHHGTGTTAWTFKIQYHEKAIVGRIDATSIVPLMAPSAADGVTITDTNGWTNSNWVQITASTGSAWTLAGVVFFGTNSWVAESELDIGVGAAASEVAVYTMRISQTDDTPSRGIYFFPIKPLAKVINSGVRVAVRMRDSDTHTADTYRCKLIYYPALTTANIVSTGSAVVLPSAANGLSVTGGGTWTTGTWVQVTASTAANYAVTAITSNGNLSNGELDFVVGTGGAGSETEVATARFWGASSSSQIAEGRIVFAQPYLVPSGTRLAVRARNSGATLTGVGVELVPSSDVLQGTSQVQLSWPTNAGAAALTPQSSAWANSPYAQIVSDSGSSDVLLTAMETLGPSPTTATTLQEEFDLAIGAAASEVNFATVAVSQNSNGLAYYPLNTPQLIPAHSRVSARFRKTGTDTGQSYGIGVNYITYIAAAVASPALYIMGLLRAPWMPSYSVVHSRKGQ